MEWRKKGVDLESDSNELQKHEYLLECLKLKVELERKSCNKLELEVCRCNYN